MHGLEWFDKKLECVPEDAKEFDEELDSTEILKNSFGSLHLVDCNETSSQTKDNDELADNQHIESKFTRKSFIHFYCLNALCDSLW